MNNPVYEGEFYGGPLDGPATFFYGMLDEVIKVNEHPEGKYHFQESGFKPRYVWKLCENTEED